MPVTLHSRSIMERDMQKRKLTYRDLAEDQAQWIIDHGGTLAGYVARYGRREDPDHYGDGGEAIYAADTTELYKLVQRAITRGEM
jgi:hypothetical protein